MKVAIAWTVLVVVGGIGLGEVLFSTVEVIRLDPRYGWQLARVVAAVVGAVWAIWTLVVASFRKSARGGR